MVFTVFSSLSGKISFSNVSKVYGGSSNLSLGGSKTLRLCTNPGLENVSLLFWAWVSFWGAFSDFSGSFGTPWGTLGDPFGYLGVTWKFFGQPLGSLVCLRASILTDFGTLVALWARKLTEGTPKEDIFMILVAFWGH